MKKKYFTIAACSVITIALVIIGLYTRGILFRKAPVSNDEPVVQDIVHKTDLSTSDIKILPLLSDNAGVDTSSGFRLLCNDQVNAEFLKTSLKIIPQQTFSLKKEAEGEYLINFTSPLKTNSIYKFEIGNGESGKYRSWAFQTKQSFNIARTLPRNQAIQVPINSGIEITFSNENVENIENYFEIKPAISGRFEFHRKTAVFIPEALEYGTVYTVMLKKGLGFKGSSEKLSEDYSFSFQTVPKENGSDGSNYFSFAETDYNFTPVTEPALQVYASENVLNTTAKVEVYKYSDENKYLEDLKKYENLPFWAIADFQKKAYDASGLEKIATFTSQLVKHENNYWYSTYLVFPDKLPQGYYLAKININDKEYYTQIQVNNLSLYIMVANNQTLAWVNDSTSGKPAAGATLTGDGIENPVKTSTEGIAAISTSFSKGAENRNYYFKISDAKNPVFVAKVSARNYYYYGNYYGFNQSDKYWSYLYLDKGMYLPDDTINIWGLVKPRDSKAENNDITLELVRNNYSWNENNNQIAIETQPTRISKNGTFNGSFRLSGFTPGSYMINIKSEGKIITSSYFQVLEYIKPAYKIDLTPSKKVMYSWEKANMDVQASFFEGSPLPGLDLSYSYSTGNAHHEGKITSDSNGFTSLALDTVSNINTWRPQQLYFNVNNLNAEEEEIRANSSITVFPRDTMVEAAATLDGDKGNIKITTSKIDISNLKESNSWYYSEDTYRGDSVNTDVEVKLFEKYWVGKEVGEYYDFINKKKVKKYEYNEVQNLIKTYELKTVNGKAEIVFNTEKNKNYYIEAKCKDSAGRETIEQQYIYNWSFNPYVENGYSINSDNNKTSFKKGESVSLSIQQDGKNVEPAENGAFLFVKLKNGIIDSVISSNPLYSFKYTDEYIPNIFVKAVYFDGVYMHNAGIFDLRYDYRDEKLDINVEPDKSSYKPGDSVKLDVDVKDFKGKPVKAEVNISIIDEAFFAVMDQYVDTLSMLYTPNISSGLITDYVSYHSPDDGGNPMAEGGEGGDGMSLRKDFKDSAYFGTAVTDNNGHAEFSFQLPDNLTSWRITYQALTEDLKAGSGKTSLSAKLPFFVDTIFNKIFMTGDSPSLLLRSYGTSLQSTDIVNYSIIVDNGTGSSQSFTAEAKGNSTVAVPIGKLKEGFYTVTVKGKSGSLIDNLQRSFKVVPEILQAARLDYNSLSETLKLSGSKKSLTSISFMNKEASILYNELLSLYWTWGDRLDQRLSRVVAGDLIKKYYTDYFISDETLDLSGYQTTDGGLALLTYDSSSPELSAKLSSFVKDKIDEDLLSSYFYNILNNKDSSLSDVVYSYWGLASLEKPVLTDIHNLLSASTPGLEVEEKLVLGIALAYIGDYEGSEKIYNEIITEKGNTEGEFTYIDAFNSRDEITKATALCSIIALKLNKPEKQRLFNYVKSNSTSELLTNLERLIYISSYIPDINQECSFSYELNGEKKSIVLKNDEKYTLVLTPEKLAGIEFSDIQGDVYAISSYTGHVTDMVPGSSTVVGINRSYMVEGSSVSTFNRSDLIKVVLTPVFKEECPDGFYEVTDILPAGLRYVSAHPDDREGWYPDEVSGQKVAFGFRYDKNYNKSKNIVYYARAVSPGTYTADSAFIKYSESNICSFAAKQAVTVK